MRMLLVAPIIYFLLERRYGLALSIFAVAGVSDALDGFLAKRYAWTSWLGGILDPLADKLLLMASYICLAWLSLLPVWLVVLVLVRDAVIVIGALCYHYLIAPLRADPSCLSKINTVAQIALVLLVIFNQAIPWLDAQWIMASVYFVAATTLLSGVIYIWQWARRARKDYQAS